MMFISLYLLDPVATRSAAAAAASGNVLEMQILRPHPGASESDTPEAGSDDAEAHTSLRTLF